MWLIGLAISTLSGIFRKKNNSWRLLNLKPTATTALHPGSSYSFPGPWEHTLNPSSDLQTSTCSILLVLPKLGLDKTELLKWHLTKEIHHRQLPCANSLLHCPGFSEECKAAVPHENENTQHCQHRIYQLELYSHSNCFFGHDRQSFCKSACEQVT